MKQYLELLDDIVNNGVDKGDRTGTGTRSVFGRQLRFDLGEGFPLLTTKKLFLKGIIYELLWFLRGDSNIKYLQDHGVKFWDDWADDDGELGPVYGVQWRSWPSWPSGQAEDIDQITEVVERIKAKPDDRRLIVCSWNVAQIEYMALPPCHLLFQFYVANGKLSCHMYQRSADVFLGVPFNIASYALLTMMVAQQCSLGLGEFIHTFGDVHIYSNHFEQVRTQLQRTPKKLPTMDITRASSIFDYQYEDFKLVGYDPDPHIAAPIAV